MREIPTLGRLANIVVYVCSALVLLTFFVGLYCALYVRSAIAEGATSNPWQNCMTERDQAKLNAGPDQALADWWLRVNIQFRRAEGGRSLSWHWHGVVTITGLALTTSPQERIEMAYPSMQRLHTCHTPPP